MYVLGGMVFLCGRRRKSVNVEKRTVRDTWTLVGRVRDRRWSFDDFDRIELTEEVRQSGKQRYTVYPVRFVGNARFHWAEHRRYVNARRIAEDLARVSEFPIHDSSGGATTVRAAHEIDQTLRERVRSRGDGVELPPRPAELKSAVSLEGDRVVIDIPGASTTGRFFVIVLTLFLGVCGLMTYCFSMLDAVAEDAKRGLFVTVGAFFLVTPFLLFLAIYLMISPRGARVVANPDGMKIDQKMFLGHKRVDLLSADIEEIALPDRGTKKGIVVRSDRTVVAFGDSLSHDEKMYIRGLLREVVTV
jgi:hypothetical protein